MVVAANAPRSARRVKPDELLPVIGFCPVVCLFAVMLHGQLILFPDATSVLHRANLEPSAESVVAKIATILGELLRKV